MANSVFKVGRSDGQKAAGNDKVVNEKYDDIDNKGLAEGGYGSYSIDSKSEIREELSDKANKKQVKRVAKKAKAGKAKAEKALGKKIPNSVFKQKLS